MGRGSRVPLRPRGEAEGGEAEMTKEQVERAVIEAFKAVFRKMREGKL
jgi:hypothetical protein